VLVKLEIYNDDEFWCGRGIGEDIFTQAKTVDELHANIREAVALHLAGRVPSSDIDILVLSQS
jgi:hypothetical protein